MILSFCVRHMLPETVEQDSQHSGISGNAGSSCVLDAAAGLSIAELSCVWTLTGALDILSLVPGEVFDEASLRWALLFLPLHNISCQGYCSMSTGQPRRGESHSRWNKNTSYLFKGTLMTHWRPSKWQFVQGGPFAFTSHRTFLLWQHSHELSTRFRRLFGMLSPMMISCGQIKITTSEDTTWRHRSKTRKMVRRAILSRCLTS